MTGTSFSDTHTCVAIATVSDDGSTRSRTRITSIPALRAALIHLFRPFPRISLPVTEQLAKLGRRKTQR